MKKKVDYLIIGAGIFGTYAAILLVKKGYEVVLVDTDIDAFQRASYINQARVHNGYHYPRSITTAAKTALYYQRFSKDFSFAINKKFKQIYAISATNSLANAEQFLKFSNQMDIPAREISTRDLFNPTNVEAAFETEEFSFDAQKMKSWLMTELGQYKNFSVYFKTNLNKVIHVGNQYKLYFNENTLEINTTHVINATYAGTNQILEKFGFEKINIKYELCEVILTSVSERLKDVGVTIMDGPFFSVMPFGLSGYHSLSAVEYTPHKASTDPLPSFDCQQYNARCTPELLDNCNTCIAKPKTNWIYMYKLAKKYLSNSIGIQYNHSLFAQKTVLRTSEIDDSRPTFVKQFSDSPSFITIFSGKFNTIYDLEDIL
jgi:hypothetical protein